MCRSDQFGNHAWWFRRTKLIGDEIEGLLRRAKQAKAVYTKQGRWIRVAKRMANQDSSYMRDQMKPFFISIIQVDF